LVGWAIWSSCLLTYLALGVTTLSQVWHDDTPERRNEGTQ
jgi:hypothetical protein